MWRETSLRTTCITRAKSGKARGGWRVDEAFAKYELRAGGWAARYALH